MADDLCHHNIHEVTKAFTAWRRENETIPTTANILKILRDTKPAQQNTKWKPPVTFTQVIRERTANWDGEILAEFRQGEHKSPLELEKLFHPKHVCMAFRRDQSDHEIHEMIWGNKKPSK